jgi:hypothetical protein
MSAIVYSRLPVNLSLGPRPYGDIPFTKNLSCFVIGLSVAKSQDSREASWMCHADESFDFQTAVAVARGVGPSMERPLVRTRGGSELHA